MNETEAYGKYGQGYIYPNNGMYHAGFITDPVIDDLMDVWEEEGRPDGDLKTFIENNSYDLDLDEDGETVYGYDFASFDEAERWVNQQLKSSRNASKKIAKWTKIDGVQTYIGDNGYSATIERAGNYRNAGYVVYWYDPNGEEIAHGAYQYYNETRENAKKLTDNPELIEQSWHNNVSR